MYSKGILLRYADTLDPESREALKREVERVQFEDGTELCVAIEAERAFRRARIGNLYVGLAERVFEFTTPEDLEALAKLSS